MVAGVAKSIINSRVCGYSPPFYITHNVRNVHTGDTRDKARRAKYKKNNNSWYNRLNQIFYNKKIV